MPVTEQSLARVLKALVFDPTTPRSQEWLVSFVGLPAEDIADCLTWLRLRKHVRRASEKFSLTETAAETVRNLIKMKLNDFLGHLEFTTKLIKDEDPLARRLFVHYYECLSVRRKWSGRGERYRRPTWAAQTHTVRLLFARIAETVKEVNADPLVFVQAQFVAFDKISDWKGEVLLPKPTQMVGINAQQRWQTFQEELEERQARALPTNQTKATKKLAVRLEEDRLQALVTFNNVKPEVVLVRMASMFSRKFLKSKGVWDAVKDEWQAAGDHL